MSDRPRRVCIVGTARHTWRDSDVAPEPLEMWEFVARQAFDDVGTDAEVLGALDHLAVVHTQSWTYDDPVRRLGERLGRDDLPGTTSLIAGTSPQRLLDQAAAAMMRCEIGAALVVGAEAQATLRRLAAIGETPQWSHPDPAPVQIEDSLKEWYLPTEIRHGVLPAWLTFALLAQARWATRGATALDRLSMYEVLSGISTVAAANPDSWLPVAHSAARLATADADNRAIATPFTKLTTAFPFVDMAAANLLVTEDIADRWGVPAERRVHLRGFGFARDASHVAARSSLSSSPAMRQAFGDALAMARLDVEEIDVFDLYSCFGSAVQFARDALDLADDDVRPVSVTGGLPYHGGPGSNYMGHSISTLVDHLRAHPEQVGMVTGIGMHMTKHVAGIWAVDPGESVLPDHDEPQRTVLPEQTDAPEVVDDATGPVTVEAASAVHAPDGSATHVVAIARLADGSRCYATSDDSDTISVVLNGEWPRATARVTPTGSGTNRLVF